MTIKDEKKIVFFINTEYVLLVSILYYYEYIDTEVKPVFVFLSHPFGKKRFRNICFDELPGYHYYFTNEMNNFTFHPNREFEQITSLKNVSEIVFQNPHFIINQYYFNFFSKQNVSKTLVSDSIAIDRNFFTFKFLINNYFKLFIRKFINRIPYIKFKIYSYKKMATISDKLIAHRNIGSQTFINSIDLLKKICSHTEILEKVFNINTYEYSKADIIFFTQPILNHHYFKAEVRKGYLKVIQRIIEIVEEKKKKIVFKVHPGEDAEFYKLNFKSNCLFIDDITNTPAEIILNSIKNKIILSFWSSVSLFDVNQNNQHYWLYKLLDYRLKGEKEYKMITTINSFEEINNILQ